jgi:hypothetical protein
MLEPEYEPEPEPEPELEPEPRSPTPAMWIAPKVAEAQEAPEADDEEPTLEPEPEPYRPWPPAAAAPAAAPPAAAPPAAAAGTYVPPTFLAAPLVEPPAPAAPEPMPIEPRTPAEPVTAVEPQLPSDSSPPVAVFPRVWDPVAAAAGEGVIAAAPPATATSRIALPKIEREKVEGVADAMMLVGTFGLVVAFLAPWARVVIGSRGSGYMESWGLAGSGHVALFVLALAVLALAVFQNPIGRWLRTGVLGVGLGAFVLGLAWPYVVGPLGAGPGAMLAWVAGLVMFIAGMVSLLVLRHSALPPDV